MLSRWFNRSNRLEHADSNIRLQAIESLSAEQAADAQDLLAKLARHDNVVAVRCAAILYVTDANALAPLLDDDTVADVVTTRVCVLIDQGQQPECARHDKVLATRIAQAQEKDLASLLPLLSTSEQCCELALRLRDETRETVLAHALLQSEAGLSMLQKAARGRDKYCHRYAREKLDLIKQARQTCDEQQQRLTELDISIHKALKQEPAERGALLVHRQKLVRLRDMRNALVEDLIETQKQLTQASGETDFPAITDDPLAEADLRVPDPQDNPFIELCETLRALQGRIFKAEDVQSLATARQAVTQSWLAHADTFPPTAEQHALLAEVTEQLQRYRNACQRGEPLAAQSLSAPPPLPDKPSFDETIAGALQVRNRWLKRWKKTITAVDWPSDHTKPQWLDHAQSELLRVSDEAQRLQTLTNTAGDQLARLVTDADQALNEGQIEQALKHMRQARALQKAGNKQHDGMLASISARLAEFRDWQKFATDPKREELLASIEQLAQAPLEPAAQAEKLKALREQWRQLGRPINAEQAAQQQQFDTQADKAFEPCRAYFAEQAQLRQDNLAARVALCEQLKNYIEQTDWHNTDIAAAETILRSARQEWHTYRPCERKALKPVEQNFEKLQEELHSKIKASWAANVAVKQQIVDQAQALANSPDEDTAQNAVQTAKNLQQQWQQVGRTPRSADQKLWREFRAACDLIFSQREQANSALKQASAEQLRQFEQAAIEFEAAAAGSEHSAKALDGFISNLNQLATDVRLSAQHRERVETARSQYQKALHNQAQAGVIADLAQWEQWDSEVCEAENNGESFEPPHAVFAQRAAGKAKPEDWLALTLEAEIAAGIASPDTDRNARMALQVRLMNEGRRDLSHEDWKALRSRWCAGGPKDAQGEQTRSRFFAALRARL